MIIWFAIIFISVFAHATSFLLDFLFDENVLKLCGAINFGVWSSFCSNNDALLFSLASFGAVVFSFLVLYLVFNFRFTSAKRSLARVWQLGIKSFSLFFVLFVAIAFYVGAFWGGWFDYEFYSGFSGVKFLLVMLVINSYFCAYLFLGFAKR